MFHRAKTAPASKRWCSSVFDVVVEIVDIGVRDRIGDQAVVGRWARDRNRSGRVL